MDTESRANVNSDSTDFVIFPYDEDSENQVPRNEREKKKVEPLSRSDRFLILLMCLSLASATMSFTVIAIFFPQVAQKKGLNIIEVGYVFSAFYLGSLVFSPLIGFLITKFGTKKVLLASLLISSVIQAIFSLTNNIQNSTWFLITTISLRLVQGFGTVGVQTAVYTIVSHQFQQRIGTITGFLEMTVGIAYSISSGLGGVIYQYAGYATPFYILTSMLLMLTIICWKCLPSNDGHIEDQTSLTDSLKLLKIPKLYFAVFPSLVYFLQQSFVASSIAPLFTWPAAPGLYPFASITKSRWQWLYEFQQSNPSDTVMALIICSATVTYTLLSFPIGIVIDKYDMVRSIMTIGFVFRGFGLAVMAPDFITGIKSSLINSVVGIVVANVGSVGAYIPLYKYLQMQVVGAEMEANFRTSTLIATLLSAIQAFGSTLGPIVLGEVIDVGGFSLTYVLTGILTASMGIIIFIDALLIRISKSGVENLKQKTKNISSDDTVTEVTPLVINDDD